MSARVGDPIPDSALVNRWVVRNDARNHINSGDPAGRLRVEDMAP